MLVHHTKYRNLCVLVSLCDL